MRAASYGTLLAIALLGACQKPTDAGPSRFASWLTEGSNQQDSQALQLYLDSKGVGDVIPLHQLLRSDSKWQKCGAQPFDVPPTAYWSHMVPTLAVIRDEVRPLFGAVEALSVFRAPEINRCIKGASQSYHLRFHAIDMRPARKVSRAALIEKLCALHARKGKALDMGLGIYKGTRFHIDTAGFRRWGHDHRAATSPCTSFVAPQRKSS